MFCSPGSHNAAAEQGLTQQLTREPKAETMLRAAGKWPAAAAASLALLVGRMGLGAALPPPGTGCPMERAQSILWGKAGGHLCSEDMHGLNLGSCRARPAGAGGMAEMTVRCWPPAPTACSTPRQLCLRNVPMRPGFGWVSSLLQRCYGRATLAPSPPKSGFYPKAVPRDGTGIQALALTLGLLSRQTPATSAQGFSRSQPDTRYCV